MEGRPGEGPARFAGATYDPVSHYRAAAVFEFFRTHRLETGGVPTDYRQNGLRLGPAPYLSDDQLRLSMEILGDILRQMEATHE